jgi:hypothetical protein
LCKNGGLQHKFCYGFTPVFDIHKLECTLPPADFDCQYRCKTAGPNTEFPTTKETTANQGNQTDGFTYQSSTNTDQMDSTTNPSVTIIHKTEATTDMTEAVTGSSVSSASHITITTDITETGTVSLEKIKPK